MSVGTAQTLGAQTVTSDERPVRVDFRSRGASFAAVFVHGFLGRADATWGNFPRLLIEHPELNEWDVYGIGYASSLRADVTGLWAENASLELLGYYLRTALGHVPLDRYRKVAIIAHSMGGLVAQQALLDPQTRSRISNLFLFGTPSAGTRRALFARALHAQARDMAEGSAFITRLRSEWSEILRENTGLKLRVVAAERDVFVPPHSSLGPFAEAMRFVVPGNHLSMVKPTDASSLAVELVAAGLLDRDASFAYRQHRVSTPTFLFTDVEGSTQRWERYPNAMGEALRRQEAIVKGAIGKNDGHVFKTLSDKIYAVFAEPERAIAAASDAQRELAAADFSGVEGIFVRAVVHRGAAEERDGDFFGAAINRITRILPIGHGGQTLVSGVTAELARPRLAPDITLGNLGMHRLRDLSDPEEIYQVEFPGVRHKFPALHSLDAKPNNLPEEANAFIGRETEIREVRTLIADHRFVSLVGTGGVGKTRLALHVAVDLFDVFPDGIWFVEFAAVTDPSLIWITVATALGLADLAGHAAEKLPAYLKNRSVLLILDNCEHLIEGIAPVVTHLLRQCAKLHIVCTSRESIRVPGERVYRMPSLPSADAVASLDASSAMSYGSIALFVDRAQSVDPHFALTEENVRTVAAICRRLDGIALAIELAAARVGAVALASLAERLETRLLALTGGSRAVPPRQQTMRSMIEWSYTLLSDRERSVFTSLAVFAGGFTLEAATYVCTQMETGLDEFELFDILSALVDKSLVTIENRSVATRYRLLESIREFGRDKLTEDGELDRAAALHASYYRRLIEAADGSYWTDESGYEVPLVELGNLRAALQWSLAEEHDVVTGSAIAAALLRFWFFGSDEGRRWAELARERLAPGSAPVVEARLSLGLVQLEALSIDLMRTSADAAVAYYRAHDDRAKLAESLYHASMTIALYFPDERALAESLAIEGLEVARSLEAPRLLAFLLRAKATAMDPRRAADRVAVLSQGLEIIRDQGVHPRLLTSYLMQLSELVFIAGHYDDALTYGLEALHEAERAETQRGLTFVRTNLAHYAVMTGDYSSARPWAREALKTALEAHDGYALTIALNALAAVEASDNNAATAAKLFGFCNARFGKLHPSRQDSSCEDVVYKHIHSRLLETFGAERLAQMMQHGESITLEQALRTIGRSDDEPAVPCAEQ